MTLIWSPFDGDELQIVHPKEKYPTLCFTPHRGKPKYYRCAGYPWNECNNAGDCIKGQCICDLGFSGNNCETVNQCYNDCNGYGPCDMDTGMCHCPGFKGIGCQFCRTGLHKSGGTDENSGDWDNSYDCYIISHQKLTFYHAQRWCSSQNIPLAEPKTDTDQENLWSKIQNIDDEEKYWIGGERNDMGILQWISSYTDIDTNSVNWETSPYVNYLGTQECVSISAQTGKWHETPCGKEYRAVCQYRFKENGPYNLVGQYQ